MQLVLDIDSQDTLSSLGKWSLERDDSGPMRVYRDEEGNPKVWIERNAAGFGTRVTQHKGFRSREPENSLRQDIQDALHVPDNCPKCDTEMRNHEKKLNFKFYYSRGKCFNCVLAEEQAIKNKAYAKYRSSREYQKRERELRRYPDNRDPYMG